MGGGAALGRVPPYEPGMARFAATTNQTRHFEAGGEFADRLKGPGRRGEEAGGG